MNVTSGILTVYGLPAAGRAAKRFSGAGWRFPTWGYFSGNYILNFCWLGGSVWMQGKRYLLLSCSQFRQVVHPEEFCFGGDKLQVGVG